MESTNTTIVSNTRLHGRWLLVARVAWITAFILLTLMYVLGFLAVHEALSTVCEEELCTLRQQIRHTEAGEQVMDWGGPPEGFADPLRRDQVKVLEPLGLTLDQYGWFGALQLGIPALVYLLIAAGLFWWKSDDWMVLFMSTMVMTLPFVDMPLPYTALVRQPVWRWIFIPAEFVAVSSFFIFPLVFPTGQVVPRWTRWKAFFDIVFALYDTLSRYYILKLPPGWDAFPYIVLSFVTNAYALSYRYFRVASPIERQQIKWVVAGVVGFISIALPVDRFLYYHPIIIDSARALVLSTIPDTIYRAITLFIPISIAISVMRYRLWDIDIIISRTLVYGALTASVVGLYILIVGGLGTLVQRQNNLPSILIAVMMIAFLFQPLRRRLQDMVNHFVPVPKVIIRASTPSPVPQVKHEQKATAVHGAPNTILRGRWLIIARLTWAAVLLTLTSMYALGFVEVRKALSTVCEDEPCTLQQQIRHTEGGEKVEGWHGPSFASADRLRPDEVGALATLGLTLEQYGWLAALQLGLPLLVYLLIAAGLFWWKSDDWMVFFASIMVATIPIGPVPLAFTLAVRLPAWEGVFDATGMVAISSLFIFPLIFPTGRFVPRWTRWTVLFDIAFAVILILFRNSIAGNPDAENLVFVYLLVAFAIGIYAQMYRYFRVASPVERQQLKWVIVGLAGFVSIGVAVLQPLDALLTSRAGSMDPAREVLLSVIPNTLFQVILLFIPVSIAISVLRYRLWDIDIIISRTLVYGTLSVSIVALYILLVGALSLLSQTTGNLLISLLATGLIAFLFQPLRERLQGSVNRLLYGDRDDPYAALSRLGRRLESTITPEAVLPTIVTTVREALKLPYTAIYLKQPDDDYKIIAESASPSLRVENGKIRVPGMEREGKCIPLIHQGETLGYLVLGPRTPSEAFSSSDLRLVDDLAPQVGVAVHAIRLTSDLQRSREQLVLAREEERRRLRRDLHDDLGPTLASLGLTASAAALLISTDPNAATRMVNELEHQIRATVGNVRRLVYDLRPPTLDELGLLAAVHERASRYSNAPDGFQVTVEAPANLPTLPAAVEVAAYRIVQEALANISKHAHARHCTICFTHQTGLEIEITDDGIGLPQSITPGVGLRSMRERAEELGGSCVIERRAEGGTRIQARLPIGAFNGSATSLDH